METLHDGGRDSSEAEIQSVDTWLTDTWLTDTV